MRAQAAAIMPWIALSGLINGFVLHYVSEGFQLSKRTALRAGLMVIPVIANITLNAILLPRIGLMGAVYSEILAASEAQGFAAPRRAPRAAARSPGSRCSDRR